MHPEYNSYELLPLSVLNRHPPAQIKEMCTPMHITAFVPLRPEFTQAMYTYLDVSKRAVLLLE